MNNMKQVGVIFLSCLIFLLGVVTIAYSLGLSLGPDEVRAFNIPLGKRISLVKFTNGKAYIEITNKNPFPTRFAINILTSKQAKCPLRKPNQDIPDTNWVQPEVPVVLIPANSSKKLDLLVTIPKKKDYSAKAYQGVIEAVSKKHKPSDLIVVGARIRMVLGTAEIPKPWYIRSKEKIKNFFTLPKAKEK